jgi:enoyl-CoA hydratase/carnithine racemase
VSTNFNGALHKCGVKHMETQVVVPATQVLFERVGEHVGVVTINRPTVRNCVNGEVAEAIENIVAETERDVSIRVVVLTGAGGQAFCTGADIAAIAAGRGSGAITKRNGFAGFVNAQRGKPWIAAVSGYALGGGLELALACALIVCGRGAKLGLPEVKRGRLAGAGGAYRLPLALPRAIAVELLLTGDPISGERAFECGLANAVVDDDAVLAEALHLAGRVAVNAPLSVYEGLAIARATLDHRFDELRRLSYEAWKRVSQSEDAKEGAAAFLAKRLPNWQGR